ncbi:Uncharacterised protein [Mycobacterium tuberculosis]|uniref:Uncharacterized protein n=1 Tax=Mycobacterium tuberculosis TaxID=1773 RepID=A0A0U0T3G7_MYCTX|nr:Uncharacterised protein [Mycobacterium tuberculosis]COW34293.1 Uncharacterised protein [Mycobacterium tuberculosis]COX18650.1 Uncharacterised protein [Mycobacterium tuberculosis]
MKHPFKRIARIQTRQQCRQRITISHITGDHRHLGPALAQQGRDFCRPVGLLTASADQNQIGHPMSPDQMGSHRRTGHAGPPSDHHGAPRQPGLPTRTIGDGQHDLADMTGLTDKPVGRRGASRIKSLDRQPRQHSGR